jgi:thiol:disulfide interchange protein DsbA
VSRAAGSFPVAAGELAHGEFEMPLKSFRALFALLLLVPALGCAQGAAKFVEGTHYQRLSQEVRVRDDSKIEVVELFWYGCVHCFHLEPLMAKWPTKTADDVDFWRSPAMWNPRMAIHAQAYYAAEALGKLEELHTPLFTALNVERKQLADADEIAAFFAKYGVSQEEFDKAFNAFGVSNAVRQADKRARAYRISGTPEMIVAGKYRVTARMAGGQSEMLQVVAPLVDIERQKRAAAVASS